MNSEIFNISIPLLAIVTLISFNLNAQITQTAIYERSHKEGDYSFLVISMDDKGIALIRDIDKYEGNKKSWEIIFVDSTLNESWTTTFEIDQRMNILGYDYRNGNIYLIFEEPENIGRKINLTEIIFSERLVKQHKFKPDVNIRYTHFSILKNKAVFAGYLMNQPTILMYDLSNENTKIIPSTFFTSVELMDVRNNSNDTFNAVMVERDSKLKKLVVRTYDSNGILLVDDVITIDEDKRLIEAVSSTLVHDDLVVMGTWTHGLNKQAAGIFSVMVDPFNDQKISYYDFAELNHFLDYLKPKKVSRIKAKAEWRKSAGKVPEFRTYLYPVKIEENKEGFSLLTEVYDPPTNYYNSRSSSPYGYNSNNYYGSYGYSPYGVGSPYRNYNSPYGAYPYSINSNNNNYTRMIHSSLLFFDDHGKLVSDQSLKFPEIKLDSKEQVSDFIHLGTRTVMVCKQEKEIIAQINQPDGTVIQAEKITPALKNPDETIQLESQENSAIRFWYGHYFYVYGHHKLKSTTEKISRDVFYINKISIN